MESITLPSRCDRNAAIALYPELRDGLASGPVSIDGSAVSQIGLAALQLLLSARQTADRTGQQLSMTLSDKSRSILATAGVDADALAGNEPKA